MEDVIERFHTKYVVSGKNECWNWTDCPTRLGYGLFSVRRKMVSAHRFALQLFLGRPIVGHVLHSCDNRLCVNPMHLREGTHRENMMEMKERGRSMNQKKTHCKYGHPFNEENTGKAVNSYTGSFRRSCRICDRRRCREYFARKREINAPAVYAVGERVSPTGFLA